MKLINADPDLYTFTDGRATVTLRNIGTNRSGDIAAYTEIRWDEEPQAGLIHHGNLNLTSERTAKSWANTCSDRIPHFDWYAAITSITYQAIKRYRSGDPPIVLADVKPSEVPRWLIRPLLEHGGPTVVAAPGGSGKSFLALSAMLTVCTGRAKFLGINASGAARPALYLDWESDQHAHANRMAALCAGAEVEVPRNLHYRREHAPLAETADELASHIREMKAAMVVVDSKGAALGGAPEDASEALRFFRAIRRLDVPTLVIDHVTNEQARQRGGASRPFGSVYTQNLARNVWMVTVGDPDPDSISVVWRHTKSNNGKLQSNIAWRMDFDMDDTDLYRSIRVRQVAARAVTHMDEGSRSDAIHELLADKGPMYAKDIAAELGLESNLVRARLSGLKGKDKADKDDLGRWEAV